MKQGKTYIVLSTGLLTILVFILLMSSIFVHLAAAASFDCVKATTSVEKLICSVKTISDLDDILSSRYKAVLLSASDKDAVKAEQRSWLKRTKKCVQG